MQGPGRVLVEIASVGSPRPQAKLRSVFCTARGTRSRAVASSESSRLASIHLDRRTSRLRSKPLNEFYKKGCQEKSSASTGGVRFFSRSSPLCFVTSEAVRLVIHSRKLSRLLVAMVESARRGKQDDVNHGSIGGSWPIAISGYPRGHSV